jgi:hypothetical protein
MSVNHYLLPIEDEELSGILSAPSSVYDIVERKRETNAVFLSKDGVAITGLIAEGKSDVLSFLMVCGPSPECGWIGKYVVEDGKVVTMEIDMCYGPPWYVKNPRVIKIADKLQDITVVEFESSFDPDELEENSVYPSGWHREGRKERLISSFVRMRDCVLKAADEGKNLLIWNA